MQKHYAQKNLNSGENVQIYIYDLPYRSTRRCSYKTRAGQLDLITLILINKLINYKLC